LFSFKKGKQIFQQIIKKHNEAEKKLDKIVSKIQHFHNLANSTKKKYWLHLLSEDFTFEQLKEQKFQISQYEFTTSRKATTKQTFKKKIQRKVGVTPSTKKQVKNFFEFLKIINCLRLKNG